VLHGEQELETTRLRVFQQLAGELNLVGLKQRLADLVTLRLQERISHAAADDDRVHLGHQVLNDADLVADLGAAENRDEWLLRVGERFPEVIELFLHQ
jgi:hypothetical protein